MIHTFSLNGYNIVLDVESTSIHLLDDIGFEILNGRDKMPSESNCIKLLKGKYDIDEITEAYNELLKLKEEGQLFSKNAYENMMDIEKKDFGLKAFCLNVAHDCNLRCRYCFASKGDYNTGRRLMSKKTALRAVDYIIENSGNRKNIEIDFFGGEPLVNFDVVKEAVLYGRRKAYKNGKQFFFTITTNGYLLNDGITEFINEHMDNVVISIDGRKEVHDCMRPDAKGNGTYERIVRNAKKLILKRNNKSWYIRGTYTSRNLDFKNDVFHLASLGFNEISVEPVVGRGEDFHIKEEHLGRILKEYDALAVSYLKQQKESVNPFRFYHFNLNLYDGPCLYKRITACGAGSEYLAVSYDGGLYACHQFTGIDEFKVGNIYDGILNNNIGRKFLKNNVFTKEDCKKCWAKYFCSGGCHANSYFTTGNIGRPDNIACTMQKKRIECAIMIEAAKLQS